jgi:hypothetical protein
MDVNGASEEYSRILNSGVHTALCVRYSYCKSTHSLGFYTRWAHQNQRTISSGVLRPIVELSQNDNYDTPSYVL